MFAVFTIRPYAFFYGLQRGSLYSLVALPLALSLGIVGLLNLAHGDFIALGMYVSYTLFTNFKIDPILSMLLLIPFLFAVGAVVYKLTVEPLLKTHHLNLLLMTFGLSIILVEMINLVWTSRPRNVYVPYATASVSIGKTTIGVYEFAYVLVALIMLLLLMAFLKKTRLGQAAFAVGQNPKGASVVGINVKFVYLFVFSLSQAILAVVSSLLLPRSSIFPLVGSSYTTKAFCVTAMAGLGNLPGILVAGIVLGLAEAVVQSIPGYGGWSDLVFFGVLIATMVFRTYRSYRRVEK